MNDAAYPGNFHRRVARWRDRAPGAVAIDTPSGERLDRAWLDAASGRCANALRGLGCLPGDRVAVQVQKSPLSLALYLGCVRAGLVFLPLNTAYRGGELQRLLDDARPRVFVRGADDPGADADAGAAGIGHVDVLDAAGSGPFGEAVLQQPAQFEDAPTDAEDIAALLYTSGTTGRPKGAMLSHRAMSWCAETLGAWWRFTADDVLLHALPLFHGHGLFVSANVALAAGARLLFQPRFDADAVLDALPRATVFMGVPTYYHRLLASPKLDAARCANVRLFACGSAPLSAEVHREWQRRTGHRIVERYGLTEAMILCSNPYDGERRPGSVGLPLPGVELRIADADDRALPGGVVGMVHVRGHGLFSGYWKMPEQTAADHAADGWFRTGDLGVVDAAGYLTITGRAKDLVISGGYNVYPAEVEMALDEHPGVRESAVIGVPHADLGEVVVAYVVPRDPTRPPAPDDVLRWAKQRLANYKVPKQVRVVDDLPRNTMGKVTKNALRDAHAQAGADGGRTAS